VGPGLLKDSSADGFILRVPTRERIQDQKISYTELKSFKRVNETELAAPTAKAMLIPTGTLVTVQLENSERFKGLLEEVSNDHMLVQVRGANGTEMRTIPFTDVQAISGKAESKPGGGVKTLLLVVVAAVAIGTIGGLVALSRPH